MSRAHLVPVFSFGENDLFNQLKNPKGSLIRTIQEGMRKTLGFSLPLFHARGVFQYSLGFMPFRQPIYTIGEWWGMGDNVGGKVTGRDG